MEKIEFLEAREQIGLAMRKLQDIHQREIKKVEEGSQEHEQLIFIQYAVTKLRDALDDIDDVMDNL